MADQEETWAVEADADDGPPPTVEGLRAQLDQARSMADEERRKGETYLDLAQRTQADFQNYKRRLEQEREKLVKDANADLLRQILPILDDLERALGHMPADMSEHSWPQGIQLIGQKLQGMLEQQGLRRIGVEGEEFDPHVHEAVAYEEHPRYGEGLIAGIYRPGYRLHERVLRPAQVTVAKARPGAAAEDTTNSSTAEGQSRAGGAVTEARGI